MCIRLVSVFAECPEITTTRAGSKVMQPMMLNDNFKVGLHFCLFQIVKIPSLHRYTNFQIFNSILEDFLIVFLETSKEV